MKDTILRFLRIIIPIALLSVSGVLEQHPATLWLIPVFVATGKAVRSKYPGTWFDTYFPW